MDYEPEYFCRSSASLFEGHTTPLIVNVGQVSTANVSMKLRYAGLETLFEEDQTTITEENPKPTLLVASIGDDEETIMNESHGEDDRREKIVNHMYVEVISLNAII